MAPEIKVEELVEGKGCGFPFCVRLGVGEGGEESIERRLFGEPAVCFLYEML